MELVLVTNRHREIDEVCTIVHCIYLLLPIQQYYKLKSTTFCIYNNVLHCNILSHKKHVKKYKNGEHNTHPLPPPPLSCQISKPNPLGTGPMEAFCSSGRARKKFFAWKKVSRRKKEKVEKSRCEYSDGMCEIQHRAGDY